MFIKIDMNKTKINEALKKQLFSADTEKVLAAINVLKDKGNKDYLPILFELTLAENGAEIDKEIQKLLGTIKDKETIPVFIATLQDDKYKTIRKKC